MKKEYVCPACKYFFIAIKDGAVKQDLPYYLRVCLKHQIYWTKPEESATHCKEWKERNEI